MPWLEDESATDACDVDVDCDDADACDGAGDGEQTSCPSCSPSVGPMGGEAPSEQVGVSDGVEGDSIQSGLFDSPSVDLFRGHDSVDGHGEPAKDGDETPYVPKHMRLS